MKRHLIIAAALIPLLTTQLFASEDSEDKGGSLSVEGTGIVSKAPDMATISAGVQSRAKTAEAALADNNAKMEALFAALEKAGIARKDIQTHNFNIHPEIVYPKRTSSAEPRPPKIVGYNVNNQIGVKIRKLSNVGSVLTALVNAGANNMSGLQFDISDKAASAQRGPQGRRRRCARQGRALCNRAWHQDQAAHLAERSRRLSPPAANVDAGRQNGDGFRRCPRLGRLHVDLHHSDHQLGARQLIRLWAHDSLAERESHAM